MTIYTCYNVNVMEVRTGTCNLFHAHYIDKQTKCTILVILKMVGRLLWYQTNKTVWDMLEQ